jgi:hypothetical protein
MRIHVRFLVAVAAAILVFLTIAGCVTPHLQLNIPPISLAIEPATVPPIQK